jgi:hypothetical protein
LGANSVCVRLHRTVREIHQDWHLWSVEDDPSTEQVLGVHGARGDVAQRGRFEILRRRLPRHFQIVGKRDHARRRPRGLGLRPHHPEELRVVPDRRGRHHQRYPPPVCLLPH